MADLGVPKEDRKAVVGHVDDDIMAEFYDAYDRLAEKRASLTLWADMLDKLLGNVVPFIFHRHLSREPPKDVRRGALGPFPSSARR